MRAPDSQRADGTRATKRGARWGAHRLEFALLPVPPFRLELAAWTVRRRPENLVDRWDGENYRRIIPVDGFPVEVAARQTGTANHPRLHVQAIASRPIPRGARPEITRALERVLGLRVDLRPFYRLARGDRRLAELAEKYEGMKPPRFPTIFEALVNAITCQQISLTVGIHLLNRLTQMAGPRLEIDRSPCYGFPRPADLSRLRPAQFRSLGFSGAKARALLELSREIISGKLNLVALAPERNEVALGRLLELRGVGRWTAEYTLLRGLGRLDMFPGDDAGARNGLADWLRLRGPMSYERVRRLLGRWQPYAGMVYFLMLLEGLAAAGRFAGPSSAGEKLERIESDV